MLLIGALIFWLTAARAPPVATGNELNPLNSTMAQSPIYVWLPRRLFVSLFQGLTPLILPPSRFRWAKRVPTPCIAPTPTPKEEALECFHFWRSTSLCVPLSSPL